MSKVASRGLADRKRAWVKDSILDTAEQLLLENDPPDFSMRQLCERAGVSFTTPFNYFGSKDGILRGLLARIFSRDLELFFEMPSSDDAIERVVAMSNVAAGQWIKRSAVHRFVATSLMSSGEGDRSFNHALHLWSTVLGDFKGLDRTMIAIARGTLARQLATMFRGTVILWTAGEIPDEKFGPLVQQGAAMLLLGFAPRKRRDALVALIEHTIEVE